jgi:NTE family protein
VLDRLLEDESLSFAAISGTSAGALNAAVLATGWARGGRVAARAALAAFWHDIGATGSCFGAPVPAGFAPPAGMPMPMPMPIPGLATYNLDWNPAYLWFNQFLRLFSPYQFNAFGDNPLRRVLAEHVDCAVLKTSEIPLFVTATAVRTGQPRVFDHTDMTVDALLASACLPQLFKAVPVPLPDGRIEHYWDGGYSGNPALWPLVYGTESLDLLLVRINPLVRPELPDTPAEIADRINEIGFNATLLGELRAIAFVQKLVEEGRIDPKDYKNLRLHMVSDDHALAPLSASSKMNTDPRFIEALFALGRVAGEGWWQANRKHLGRQATLDIRQTFLAADTA